MIELQKSMFPCLLPLLGITCGPQVEDDTAMEAAGPAAADEGCEESSCPLACADRTCVGALGIGRCIDEKCSPTPLECVIESRPEETCTEVCAGAGDGVVCVENGCEGATAFGYPWSERESLMVCGESTPDIRAGVTHIEGSCDAPFVFSGDGSFALYQCCCDHPDY